MADLDFKEASQAVQIVGEDEALGVEVKNFSGENRLLTQSEVQVSINEIKGLDGFADAYATIVKAGSVGDTWTIALDATNLDTTSPNANAPSMSVVITITSNEAGDELKARDLIVSTLNNAPSFKNAFLIARPALDNPVFQIASIKRGVFFERPNANSFSVTVTGTASRTLGFNNFIQRTKINSITADIDSPHNLGIQGISGTVLVTPAAISNSFQKLALNGGSENMAIDGTTPVEFLINADIAQDIHVNELRFFGGDTGVKFGKDKFLGINSALANGIKIDIQSEGNMINFLPLMKITQDLKSRFTSKAATNWLLDVSPSVDDFLAVRPFPNPFILKKQGTFVTDDFIKITIQDILLDLSSLFFEARGFLK